MRSYNRSYNEIRPLELIPGYAKNADGSCLIKCGDTVVLCSASIDERTPHFLKNTGNGWITAEYGMLPRSTSTRMQREAAKGSQSGRTQEIQRLIGRSLRAAVDLSALGERQIIIDCDVIQADGGTRTASITGGYIALCEAIKLLTRKGLLRKSPMKTQIAAISSGIVRGQPLLDLDYHEDSDADIDANFVFDGFGKFVEMQLTGEKTSFDQNLLNSMIELSKIAAAKILQIQKEILMKSI